MLEHILHRHDIDTRRWRTCFGVKTVKHLWKEIVERECVLILRKKHGRYCLVRVVNKVYLNVFCRHHGRLGYLRETKQVFADGGRRHRNGTGRPSIGEKIQPSEAVSRAFGRALEEELAVSDGYIVARRKKVSVRKKPSNSYPGLMSHLTTHSFHAELSPKRYRKRYVERQSDKTTFFEWRPVSRCPRFVRQYQRLRKAFKRRRCNVRKLSMFLKRAAVHPLKRYIVY